MENIKKPLWIKVISAVTIIFGMATIKEGGSVLFTEEGRLSAGNFVPFVLWFNFIAGFIYILAGIAIFRLNKCSKHLSSMIAVSSLLVFICFGIHIFNGGAYEVRTVIAMTIRTSLWIIISIMTIRSKDLSCKNC